MVPRDRLLFPNRSESNLLCWLNCNFIADNAPAVQGCGQSGDLMVFDPFGDFETKGYLRNSMGLRDMRAIKHAEHLAFKAHVEDVLVALATRGERLGYQDVLYAHKQFFGSLYPWAGKDRAAVLPGQAVGKGTDFELFAHPQDIQRAMEHGLEMGQDAETLRHRPGEVMGYLAYAHPFLDGNGRTIMAVHAELMRRADMHIHWRAIGKTRYLGALTQELSTPGQGFLDGLLKPHIRQGALEISEIAAKFRALRGLGPAVKPKSQGKPRGHR